MTLIALRFYPDELFVSGLARYVELMNYPGRRSWCQEFFNGDQNYRIYPDLPGNVGAFCDAFYFESEIYTKDYILQHTLFPFFFPFLQREHQSKLRAFMVGRIRHPGKIRPMIGQSDYYRFCASCVQEDRIFYGETYWHCVHQVCRICPHHFEIIQDSQVYKWPKERRHTELITAESALKGWILEAHELEMENRNREYLHQLSDDILWLQNNWLSSEDREKIRLRLYTLLANHSFFSAAGVLKTTDLWNAVKECYPESFMQLFGYSLEGDSRKNWLTKLLFAYQSPAAHPILHLLLIHSLGHTIKTFLKITPTYEWFGLDTWMCENPICSDYHCPSTHQPEVIEIDGKLYGIFACHCGYQYRKLYAPLGESRTPQVIEYGPLWEQQFRSLWLKSDPPTSNRTLGKIFKTNNSGINRHATRLGLLAGTQTLLE